MKRIFILLFLLPLLSKAQVYQAMPQAGYGPVKRMLFDSVLTLPLGIAKLQNITGGRDTGQIRYNKVDSSLYIYSGSAWRKVTGGSGGSTDTTSLSNRINNKVSKSGDVMTGSLQIGTGFIETPATLRTTGGIYANGSIDGNELYGGNRLTGGNYLYGGGEIETGKVAITSNSLSTDALNIQAIESVGINVNATGGLYTAIKANSDDGNHADFGNGKIVIENSGKLISVDTLIGKAIKRTSGTSAQYLMANGSISTVGSGLSLSGGVLSNTATPTPLGYYGAFQDNTIQTAAAINTPYAMKFGVTDLNNQVTIVSDGSNLTKITIANTGVYNIQFSAQFDRTNSGTDVVDIWLRKNGVDVAGSGGKIVMSGGATASQIIAAWNYVLDVTAGDYYQLMWSTPDTHVRLLYEAAQTSPFAHPIIPSVILTVTQQSGIMAGTGVTAINSLTGSAQTMVTGTDSTDFKIVSTGTQHKFNLPTASSTKRGALSSADWTTFNGKMNYSDTASLSTRINNRVSLTGNETIAGTKTFSSAPIFTDTWANGQATFGSVGQGGRINFLRGGTGSSAGTIGMNSAGDNTILAMTGTDKVVVTSTGDNTISTTGTSNAVNINAQGTNGLLKFRTSATQNAQVFQTGNWVFQNGGTFVDNTTDRIQVIGNITSTATVKADTISTRALTASGVIIGSNIATIITLGTSVANSTTTLADLLSTTTLAAGTYRFSSLISYNAATTGTGARFVLDGTGTAPTGLSFSNIRTLTASTQSPVFGSAYLVPAAATATSLTTGNICKIEGVITLPSTAVLTIKFASSTTSAITVLAGTTFDILKL
jgi:hypothetical protein